MSLFYSVNFKWKLYELYCQGHTLVSLTQKYKVTDKTLTSWFSKFEQTCAEFSSPTNFLTLVKQVQTLNQQLMECNAERRMVRCILENIPKEQRIQAAYTTLAQHGVNAACRALNLQKANLYYHLSYRVKKTTYEERDEYLLPLIQNIIGSAKKHIGAESIRLQLLDQGVSVSKGKILNLMHSITPIRIRETYSHSYQTAAKPNRPNILNRQFNQPAPNLAWVSDITEIKTKDGKYHLCVIIDLFSRKVISYQLSEQNDAALVRATFQQAYHVRGLPEGLLFHSDQGTQYTSFDFQSLLIHHSVMQSFSNPGVPYDNAAMESFFSHLKTEEIHRYTYRSADELLAAIKEYIHFHNHQRPHSSIGNLTPEQVEQQYQARKCNNGLVELADVRENRN